MRVWLMTLCFLMAPVLGANCLPESIVPAQLEAIHEDPCYGGPACLEQKLENVESLLATRPDAMVLHRKRQDLVFQLDPFRASEIADALAAEYQDYPGLESPERDYLIARLERDAEGLREAMTWFPWARLDLIRHARQADHEPMVDAEEAETLLGEFLAECPAATTLMLHEARGLAVNLSWPVWREVRQNLLAMGTPPWQLIDSRLIQAELVQDHDVDDPAARLITELDAVADRHAQDAGYWNYRARIHLQARNLEQALEANAKARELDPCRQVSPGQRRLPGEADELDPTFFDEISEEILNCPPDLDTYQYWLQSASLVPERVSATTLEQVRAAISEQAFGAHTASLERALAVQDILMGHETQAAWATLQRLFDYTREYIDKTVPKGAQAGFAIDMIMRAQSHAQLGLTKGNPDQSEKWLHVADQLFRAHQSALEANSGFDEMRAFIEANRTKLDWLLARSEQRHADAVIFALSARANRHPGIDMDEVVESWAAAGGSDQGFEQLLSVWGLELPAQWRGWRRLGKPLDDFELTDMQGDTWMLADLDGKRTLINLWATWCGPCMLELPKVQELHEHYKDDPTVQILTVNLDTDNAVTRKLMENQGWDFPVLVSGHESQAFSNLAIPRNWLVDGAGARQWEQTGFNVEIAEHWVEDISSLLELMD